MFQNVKIARADMDEIEDLVSMFEQNYDFHQKMEPEILSQRYQYDRKRNQLINSINNPNHLLSVAKINSTRIGYVYGLIDQIEETNQNIIFYLIDIYVAPPYRKNGVGARLINYVEDFCRDRKINSIILDVLASNKIGVKFYNNFKFRQVNIRLMKCI